MAGGVPDAVPYGCDGLGSGPPAAGAWGTCDSGDSGDVVAGECALVEGGWGRPAPDDGQSRCPAVKYTMTSTTGTTTPIARSTEPYHRGDSANVSTSGSRERWLDVPSMVCSGNAATKSRTARSGSIPTSLA